MSTDDTPQDNALDEANNPALHKVTLTFEIHLLLDDPDNWLRIEAHAKQGDYEVHQTKHHSRLSFSYNEAGHLFNHLRYELHESAPSFLDITTDLGLTD